jgi:hypothetical protein
MLRSNIRLIFGGLGAVALGLAGGWGVLALTFQETSALTKQAAIARPAVPDITREPAPAVATPAPDPAPAETAVKPAPVAPAPARIAERTSPPSIVGVPNADAVPTPSSVRSPSIAPTAGKPTKVSAHVPGKRRVPVRPCDDDDDDDDC